VYLSRLAVQFSRTRDQKRVSLFPLTSTYYYLSRPYVECTRVQHIRRPSNHTWTHMHAYAFNCNTKKCVSDNMIVA
jgi:hypothetical protein